jgi:hypothetical protein
MIWGWSIMLKIRRRQSDEQEPRHVVVVEEGAKEGVCEGGGEAQDMVEGLL